MTPEEYIYHCKKQALSCARSYALYSEGDRLFSILFSLGALMFASSSLALACMEFYWFQGIAIVGCALFLEHLREHVTKGIPRTQRLLEIRERFLNYATIMERIR